MARDDYAIVVGISKYPKYDGLSDLEGPENDVANFVEWLESSTGGGVRAKKIEKIISSQFPDPNDRPWYSDVEDVIDGYLVDANSQGGRLGRRLYLFFAGHGIATDINTPLLLAANARSDRLGAHLPGRAYADYLKTWGTFDEIILFMDCCQDYEKNTIPRVLEWGNPSHTPNEAKSFYGFAAKLDEQAREMKMADGKVHGVFTVALVEALNQGQINGAELERYVYNRMTELLPPNKFHEPKFPSGDASSIIFGMGGRAKTPILITFSMLDSNAKVALIDGDFNELAMRQGTESSWQLELDPGLYEVVVNGSDNGKMFKVIGTSEVTVHV